MSWFVAAVRVSLNKYDNKLAKSWTLMCCVVNINNINCYRLNASANLSKFLLSSDTSSEIRSKTKLPILELVYRYNM